ncbi:hypothetical protein HAX54_043971 [Datura stramonium]|uniref:Uncharacterized protein n=1 Tax=Datura stramonium TaxID=4076 RepID=A0ABS8W3V8_DATST|nr:hypothetical protein [Datura stramonium]
MGSKQIMGAGECPLVAVKAVVHCPQAPQKWFSATRLCIRVAGQGTMEQESRSTSLSLERQEEAELKLIERRNCKRVEDAIKRKVDGLNTEEIKLEIRRKRVEEGRKKQLNEVAAQQKEGICSY